jgi:predicted metalloprotease with PDZ domain
MARAVGSAPHWMSFDRVGDAELIAAGVAPEDVEWLRERIAENEQRRAALQSIEGGRGLTPDEAQALHEVDSELAREIGSDNYDRLLYAAGRHNRLRVSAVAEWGAAAEAGLKSGDLVLSYDGVRIFGESDLYAVVDGAARGLLVPIVYQREGQVMQGQIRAGRLGVGVEPVRAKPSPP